MDHAVNIPQYITKASVLVSKLRYLIFSVLLKIFICLN